tara:strand:- start:2668 stop:3018 length:351 start_codon:yes stop_codon:yes gene_type:complete
VAKTITFIFIIFLLILTPKGSNSAEILQIIDSTNILIGDQNRNISINLLCANVEKENELNAIKLLKINFPRGTKVRIKPYGLKDDILQARVFKMNDEEDMSELLLSNNLSTNNCKN